MRTARLTHRFFCILALLCPATQAAHDITAPGDTIVGVPNDGDWPSQERPALAIDDHADTKYLHAKGDRFPDAGPTGFRVTPAVGPTVVTGLTFTTANDCPARDPIAFELYGSNASIDGPFELIASGEIVDFAEAFAWPRNQRTETPIVFANDAAYAHYQVLFPCIRNPADACANSMQIGEVELLALDYKATSPIPADGAVIMTLSELQWTAGESAVRHNLYLGRTPELTGSNLLVSQEPALSSVYEPAMLLESGVTYYWRVDSIDAGGSIYVGDVWHFVAAPDTAYAPRPRDGDKWIDFDTVLFWRPGREAIEHEVYFGADESAVTARDLSVFRGSHEAAVYDPQPLEPGTTYYWAVDEVSDGRHEGPVWSFTTFGGGGVKAEYFENVTLSGEPVVTRIEDRISHRWGYGPIAGVRNDHMSARWTADLEIAIADTYTFVTTSDDGVRLWLNGEPIIENWTDHGPMDDYSVPMDLAPGIYTLELEWYELWNGAMIRLWWETPSMGRQIIPAGPLQPPFRARPLYPAGNEVNVPQNPILRWAPGDRAVMHDVYFGSDADAVAEATPADTHVFRDTLALEETSWAPGPLDWNATYYWRIDEVNPEDPASPWRGAVCSFTTADVLIVEDFESYTSRPGQAIFETWIDGVDRLGLPGNGSGAIVAHPPVADDPRADIAETRIVHGGRRSMPLHYENADLPHYSETQKVWATPQDWTLGQGDNLSLWFRGHPAAFREIAPGRYQVSSTSGDIWGNRDHFRFAYQQLTGNGSITARIDSVTETADWTKAGVMIRDSLDPGAVHAFMLATPTGRRAFQNRPDAGLGTTYSTHSVPGAIEFPVWVRLEREGSVFTAFYSNDGETWAPQPSVENSDSDACPNPQTINIRPRGSVCIGLALASKNPEVAAVAEFANVTTTGSVSGSWQMADVGGVNPANSPGRLYVAVRDAADRRAVIGHPALEAPLVTEWTEWKIPLADLTSLGLTTTAIQGLSIGVDNRNAEVSAGSGTVYVDDVRITD